METSDLVLTVAVIIEFVVGITLNMNVLLVYIGNLRNGSYLGPSDRVHLAKALVNISMHVVMTVQCMIYVFWTHLFFINELFLLITIIVMFLIIYNYWLTAMLCVYYSMNITNCGHHCFVWLKRSLSSYLLHNLLVSGLGSIALSIPIFWFCVINPSGNSTHRSMIFQAIFIHNLKYKITFVILGSNLPFSIAFISTTFSSWSLLSHIWRMKQNNPGFSTSQLQPHINATRMILFLLIFIIYNVTQMMFFTILPRTSMALVIVSWFVISSYPISEAIIINQSSKKLRSALLGKFCDRKRKTSETET